MAHHKHERAKADSVRKRHTPIITVVAVLVLAWTALLPAPAEQDPEGALRIPEGGYLYAEHHEDFTDVRKDGLTIEIWFKLTDLPDDNVGWPLISKEGSYAIALCGWNPLVGREEGVEDGTVTLATEWYSTEFLGRPAFAFFDRSRTAWPAGTWSHVAYQLLSDPEVRRYEQHLNGERLVGNEIFGNSVPGTLESPLFVGDSAWRLYTHRHRQRSPGAWMRIATSDRWRAGSTRYASPRDGATCTEEDA